MKAWVLLRLAACTTLAGVFVGVAGCNTMAGFGQDVSDTGHAIKKAAE
jgi:entericidin A